jgi:hypothetical protein
MSAEVLRGLVLDRDFVGLRNFFKDLSESERRQLAPAASEMFNAASQSRVETFFDHWPESTKARAIERSTAQALHKVAAFSCVLACCRLSEIRSAHRDFNLMACVEFVSDELGALPVQVLADRNPKWAQSYVNWLVEQTRQSFSSIKWLFIWRFVRAGICERPDSPLYFRAFSMTAWVSRAFGDVGPLPDFMSRHCKELQAELWSLFTVDEAVHGQLWSLDTHSWENVLTVLQERKLLPRARLLQESLRALNRDFRQIQHRWYTTFHEHLAPSLEERKALEADYRALLPARLGTTIKLALNALETLDKAGQLDAPELVDSISPVLEDSAKHIAVQALRLLDSILLKSPDLQIKAVSVLSHGLLHPAADVNERAFKLIARHSTPEDTDLLAVISERVQHAAPSVQMLAEEWLGPVGGTEAVTPTHDPESLLKRARALPTDLLRLAGLSEREGLVRHPLNFARTEVPCLDPEAKLEPTVDLDELVEVATRQTVAPEDADDWERIYDGVARLGLHRPPHFTDLTGQLAKHLASTNLAFLDDDVVGVMRQFLRIWLSGAVMPRIPEPGRFLGRFLLERVGHISHRLASGIAQGLLSCPTHRGGWIDPEVLVERALRLQTAGGSSDRLDWVLAIFRLAPDRRHRALVNAKALNDETGAALRYALGGPLEESQCRSMWLWAAASRSRDPDSRDPSIERRFPSLGGEQAAPAEFEHFVYSSRNVVFGQERMVIDVKASPPMREDKDQPYITVLYQSDGRPGRRTYSFRTNNLVDVRWLASIWPMRREPYFALAVSELGFNMDWAGTHWQHKAWYEPLLDPDCPLGEMAMLLLAVGLASKQPVECGLATDILIAGIADGRIEGGDLGTSMGKLLFSWLVKPNRWAHCLAEAARVSPLHSRIVRAAIERALADAKGSPPHGLHTLLELLYQLSVGTGEAVHDVRTLEFLSGLKGSSKLAKAAKQLITLPDNPEPTYRAKADAIALEGRLERAERWHSWRQAGEMM